MSRRVAGIAAGAHCADPVDVQGAANRVDTGVDENAVATLRFADGMLAQLACSITAVQDNTVRIFGTEGWIEVPSPWFCSGRQGGRSVLRIHTPAGTSEEIAPETTDWPSSIAADSFPDGLAPGEPITPLPPP